MQLLLIHAKNFEKMKTVNLTTTFLLAFFGFCLFIGCSKNDDYQTDFPNISKTKVSNMSTSNRKHRTWTSKNRYNVSLEDISKFSRTIKPNKDYSVEAYSIENDTLLYVLNYDEGWMILAGDKRFNPIVAECDSGEILLDIANENLMCWIDSYADEIRVLKPKIGETENEHTKLWSLISKSTIKQGKTPKERDYKWCAIYNSYCDNDITYSLIPHLVSTKWGQSSPWNGKCPIDTNSNNQKCPTGCVAVALAQMIYYMHYHLGKPSWLYHDISIAYSTIAGPTSNIGFSRANFVTNSTRWDDMPLTSYGTGNTTYVGDLMLDIGNRLSMTYSGTGSNANISTSALNNYNLTYSTSSYNYQTVKNDLQNAKPVDVFAYRNIGNNQLSGHSWLIDGIAVRQRHYVTYISFEYSENWMYANEYFDTFLELQEYFEPRFHVYTPYDVIEEDGGTYTTEYLLMNWGWDGAYDNGYFSTYPSDSWIVGNYDYKYNKTIHYDFR